MFNSLLATAFFYLVPLLPFPPTPLYSPLSRQNVPGETPATPHHCFQWLPTVLGTGNESLNWSTRPSQRWPLCPSLTSTRASSPHVQPFWPSSDLWPHQALGVTGSWAKAPSAHSALSPINPAHLSDSCSTVLLQRAFCGHSSSPSLKPDFFFSPLQDLDMSLNVSNYAFIQLDYLSNTCLFYQTLNSWRAETWYFNVCHYILNM